MFQKASRGLDLWVDDHIVEHDVWLKPEESDEKKQGDEGGTAQEQLVIKSCHWRGSPRYSDEEIDEEDELEAQAATRIFGH